MQQADQAKAMEAAKRTEAFLRKVLTPEAKTRLNTAKIANKQNYSRVIQTLVALHNQGRLQGKLDEEDVKELLSMGSAKREFNIRRV